MRLLILNHNVRERGTYFRAWPIARGLAAHGHEVVFATVSPVRLYRTTFEERDGIRVLETPRWTWPGLEADDGWGPLSLLERVRLALRERFDWVYAFAHPPLCSLPAMIARRRGARLTVDWCDDYGEGIFPQREMLRRQAERQQPAKWFVQRLAERHETKSEIAILKKAARVTVISEILRDKTIAAGVDPQRVLLVPSGGDLKTFFPQPREQARRQLNLPLSGPLLSYVANYHPDEPFLMEVLRRVFERAPQARMVYAGPSFADPRARDPLLAERLIHLGHIPSEQIPPVIAAGDIALLPMADTHHNRARCPQKLMDYFASGRPIVTCDVGEVGRILRTHPQTGRASAPTASDFSEAILELLVATPEQREVMGHAARKAAEEEFNWDRAVKQIEGVLL